jgi:hypothetical protein
MTENLNVLAKGVYELNSDWWHDLYKWKPIERSLPDLLMLVITDLADACEGVCKGIMDDILPHRSAEEVAMADAYIRLLDLAGCFKLELVEYFTSRTPGLVDRKLERIFAIVGVLFGATLDTSHRVSKALSLIESYCNDYSLALKPAMWEKIEYNLQRDDHRPGRLESFRHNLK